MPGQALLHSTEPRIAELLARHRAAAASIDWSYHEFLPLGAFQAPRNTQALSRPAYVAVETALLTEANLPWYTATLYAGLRDTPAPLQEFVRVWTAEEDQHSTLLETYLLLTGNGDHAQRNRIRKGVVGAGWEHGLRGPFDGMVYTTVQELATRAFYLDTARACQAEDPALARALRRIAQDEALHYAFYRDVVKAHLDADPDYVEMLAEVLIRFQMPGYVIPGFEERSVLLATSGVFGPEQFYEGVVASLWAYWQVDALAPCSDAARRGLRRLHAYRAALRRLIGPAAHAAAALSTE